MTQSRTQRKVRTLLAEGTALEKAYERLRFSPVDSPNHAAHSERIRRHRERVRHYLHELRSTQDDDT